MGVHAESVGGVVCGASVAAHVNASTLTRSASAMVCRTTRRPMMLSHRFCSARAFAGISCAAAASGELAVDRRRHPEVQRQPGQQRDERPAAEPGL